jgi:heat shock protein HslJ
MKAARLMMLASAATVALAFTLAGCAQPGVSTPDPRLSGAWHLVTAQDAQGVLVFDGQAITLSIGTFTGGASPCNGYSATVAGGIGVVYIQTYQHLDGEACPNQVALDLDSRYLKALAASQFATIRNGMLRLSSSTTLLVYSRTALPVPDIEQSTWYLAQLPVDTKSHAAVSAYNPPISLTFQGYNGLRLDTTCSEFDATYTVKGSRITVGTILFHLKATKLCSSVGKTVDERVEGLLFSPFTADISYAAGDRGTTLVITNLTAKLSALFVPRAAQ